MRKFIVTNVNTGDKVFCTYEMYKTGFLSVNYFLPKTSGFSLKWTNDRTFRVAGISGHKDGKRTIVTYHIHPTFWMGRDMNIRTYQTWYDAMNICFARNINLHI